MRLLFVAALLMMPACLTECDGVGAIGSMRQGVMSHGAARGDMTPPADGDAAPAVVRIDWPFTPTLLWEAGKETTFADGDPVETPTQFGSQDTVLPTMVTAAKQAQFQASCAVGPAIPCFYFDGGDTWREAAANAALKYLHDGTGMTCYVVRELVTGTTTGGYIIGTQTSGTAVGYKWNNNASAPPRWVSIVGNGSASIITNLPGSGAGSIDATIAAHVTHGTARTSDFSWGFEGITNTGQSDYTGAVSTSNPSVALTIAANAAESAATFALQYLFALACENALHDATMIADTYDAIEAVTGALPQ
jgi:hypothetical protein